MSIIRIQNAQMYLDDHFLYKNTYTLERLKWSSKTKTKEIGKLNPKKEDPTSNHIN